MSDLIIVDAQGEQHNLELSDDEYIIGRDPAVSLVLEGAKISRRHARLYRERGTWWLEDLKSANGVFVGDARICEPVELAPGVVVSLGGYALRLADELSATVPAPTLAPGIVLLGTNAPCAGLRVDVPNEGLYVGRSAECELVIDDPSVSRRHARVVLETGALVVQDLGSSNGSFINDVKIERQQAAPGDRLRFGDIEFALAIAEARDLAPTRWLVPSLIASASVLLILATLTLGLALRQRRGPRGPSLMTRYEAGLLTGLALAEAQLGRDELDDAEREFRSVLVRDPINAQAQSGLRRVQILRDHRRALAAARDALGGNRPAEAVQALVGIGAESPLAPLAAQLRDQAHAVMTDNALRAARTACRQEDWPVCHREAVSVLEALGSSAEALALAAESESVMHDKRLGYTPWPGLSDAREALAAMLGDEELRSAALRYGSGDLETATKRARAFSYRNGGERLLNMLVDARRAYDAAEAGNQADANQMSNAWQAALDIDAKILPASYPSALRAVMRSRLAHAVFVLGEAAKNRGAWAEAYTRWQQGLTLAPRDPELLGGLGRLEARAAGILKDLGDSLTTPAACAAYDEVLHTTAAGSPTNLLAKERKRGCPP